MAKPRVFVSSTYYDLKYVRASLEAFIESLGFEPILSERGDIAYLPDRPLDESCYREAGLADVFVLIMGGRYGSAASSEGMTADTASRKRYESVTKVEFEGAIKNDIPCYILIERDVYSEYRTYVNNPDNDTIKYYTVDDVNIFRFIDSILRLKENNPVHPFERPGDIETWLREQWAGFFQELLRNRSREKQIKAISDQIAELAGHNKTLKKYLEEVLSKTSPDESVKIIKSEEQRLRQEDAQRELSGIRPVAILIKSELIRFEDAYDALCRADTYYKWLKEISGLFAKNKAHRSRLAGMALGPQNVSEANDVRRMLGLHEFKMPEKHFKIDGKVFFEYEPLRA